MNHRVIGKGPSLSPGWLLEDGDVVAISPLVTFTFTQHREPSPCQLSSHQREEAKVSRPGVRRSPAIRKETYFASARGYERCLHGQVHPSQHQRQTLYLQRCVSTPFNMCLSIFSVVQMAIFNYNGVDVGSQGNSILQGAFAM